LPLFYGISGIANAHPDFVEIEGHIQHKLPLTMARMSQLFLASRRSWRCPGANSLTLEV
jgi:hypothetical protein